MDKGDYFLYYYTIDLSDAKKNYEIELILSLYL